MYTHESGPFPWLVHGRSPMQTCVRTSIRAVRQGADADEENDLHIPSVTPRLIAQALAKYLVGRHLTYPPVEADWLPVNFATEDRSIALTGLMGFDGYLRRLCSTTVMATALFPLRNKPRLRR